MKATRLLLACSVCAALTAASGCLFVPKTQLSASQGRNRALAEQSRAQLAEIENLKIHARNTENQLIRTEEELGLLEEEVGLDRKQLVDYRRERAALQEQFKGLAGPQAGIPAEVGRQLVGLSERFPSLQFDSATGISKLQSDILFDTGQTQLKPGAEKMLRALAAVLKSPEARGLKVLVAGHTDDRRIATRPAREKFPNNFHLSTARAHAVADTMCREGFPEERLGVAGFGSHQPIAPNVTPQDRRKNRRVEIFVMAVDVPVVGWTESIPSLY